MRTIQSFVRRQGRITPGQTQALEEHGAHYLITDFQHPQSHFPSVQPLIVEIGFGNGETFVAMANANPHYNFLGIEVHLPGVGRVIRSLALQNMQHVRVANSDAVAVLNALPPGSLAAVHIFFPDPWHKKRHNKRRLIQKDFLNVIYDRLSREGVLCIATDWQPYFEHITALIAADQRWTPGQALMPRLTTKYERRGLRLAHQVFDLMLTKIS